MDEPDLTTPSGRLEAAVTDLIRFREEWQQAGSPTLAKGSIDQQTMHPLVRAIRESERAVGFLSRPAAAKRGGRPVGAQSALDRKQRFRRIE